MTRQARWFPAALCGVLAAAASARAQPAPPDDAAGTGSGSAASPAMPVEYKPPEPPPPPPAPPPAKPVASAHAIDMPMVLGTPTGWLLPAAVLYSRSGLDTGGGVKSDNRVGLGDVAEFGIATLDDVRTRADAASASDRLQPYFAATFRMGVAERRLFDQQPGMVIGFRKSFEHDDSGVKSQIAELTFVLSKHLGSRAAVHVGGAFWDASLKSDTIDTSLHDRSVHKLTDQIRPFGGIELSPFPRSQILIDWSWAPEFCPGCTGADQIKLVPELAWGVRYQISGSIFLESGVRVPEIDKARLLDAQIFGQVTFTSWALRRTVDSWK